MSSAILEVDKTLTSNLDQRLKNITNAIDKKKNTNGSDQKIAMKTIQAKLAKSHEISLKLVIDVSRLLKKYQEYFDKLDDQLKKINVDFSRDDAEYLQKFSDSGMIDLTNQFTRHIESLKRYYQTTGYSSSSSEMSRLKDLENLHSTLLSDIKYFNSTGQNPDLSEKNNTQWFSGIKFFNKPTGGGAAVKKKHSAKIDNKERKTNIQKKKKISSKTSPRASSKTSPKISSKTLPKISSKTSSKIPPKKKISSKKTKSKY